MCHLCLVSLASAGLRNRDPRTEFVQIAFCNDSAEKAKVHFDDDPVTDGEESSASEDSAGLMGEKVSRALHRKYRNISKAVMEDPMFFFDEIFSIEPLSGREGGAPCVYCHGAGVQGPDMEILS